MFDRGVFVGLCEKCLEIARGASKRAKQEESSDAEAEGFASKRRRHRSEAVRGSVSEQSVSLKPHSRDDLQIERCGMLCL